MEHYLLYPRIIEEKKILPKEPTTTTIYIPKKIQTNSSDIQQTQSNEVNAIHINDTPANNTTSGTHNNLNTKLNNNNNDNNDVNRIKNINNQNNTSIFNNNQHNNNTNDNVSTLNPESLNFIPKKETQEETISSSSLSNYEHYCHISIGIIGDNDSFKNNIFSGLIGRSHNFFEHSQPNCRIEAVSELIREKNLIVTFLKLSSPRDFEIFEKLCEISEKESMSEEDFHFWILKQECRYFKALIYMFLICNRIFICSEKTYFNIEYIKIFKILASVRQFLYKSSLYNSLSNQISEYGKSSRYLPAKSLPTVSFIFNLKTTKPQSSLFIQEMEKNIENQIQTLFKKFRIYSLTKDLLNFHSEIVTCYQTIYSKSNQNQFLFNFLDFKDLYNNENENENLKIENDDHYQIWEERGNEIFQNVINEPYFSNRKLLPSFILWNNCIKIIQEFLSKKSKVILQDKIKKKINTELQFTPK